MELESGTKTNLTESPGEERRPRIRTDGIQVAYSSGESDSEERGIYRVEARRQTLRTSVCQDCGLPLDWSSQGDEILVVDRIRGGKGSGVDLLDVTSGRRLKLLEHAQHSVVQAKLDPADRWVAFTVVEDPLQARIYVAPFRQEEFHESSGIAPERWVAVTDGQDRDGMTGWSPNGKLLYFVSNRGGARGIWVQELDPKDRRPVGDPRLVWHFRETRLSLAGVSPSSLRTNVARDKLVFTLKERMGDIWMAHFPLEEERLIRPPWRPGRSGSSTCIPTAGGELGGATFLSPIGTGGFLAACWRGDFLSPCWDHRGDGSPPPHSGVATAGGATRSRPPWGNFQ